jgi:opacity protein-like surface antigen
MFRITTMNVRRRKAMRKLFLVALIICVCATAIMAQESAKPGIYGALQNLRFNAMEAIKKDANFNSTADATAMAGAAGAPAQCRGCPDGHTHVEIYGGYSFLLLDGFETVNDNFNDVLDNRLHFHGADLSATFNFSRYVGAQFDFSIHRRNENLFDFGIPGNAEANIQHYLFGVQVKNNTKDGGRFRPFGQFLLGVSRQRLEFDSTLLIPIIGDDEFSFRKNSFALAMGGGIDVRITGVFSIRPIKLDYLPVFIDNFTAFGINFNSRTQHNFRAGAGAVFHF